MTVINKPGLVEAIAEKTGESKAATERFLSAFQETVIESVKEGAEVKITGFVAFSRTTRSARVVKNPRTGEDIQVGESVAPKIRPLKHFRDVISNKKD